MPLAPIALLLGATLSIASPLSGTSLHKRVATNGSVTFDGRQFVNRGLAGFGRISADQKDSEGETVGGIGSSIALESFSKTANGSYTAVLITQPDRGHNTQTTTDYRARSHRFVVSFNPSQGNSTTENIKAVYNSTTLYTLSPSTFGGDTNFTTGLDPTVVRPASASEPALPIAPDDNHVAFDTEGIALIPSTTRAWISDEYGPYIYQVDLSNGSVLNAIQPPKAFLPYINGTLNFTSVTTPDTGRAPNQGFEGLTLDRSTNTLWAFLQSALIQDTDGTGSKTTNRYSRLLGYNVGGSQPKLVASYVVPLPQSSKANTRQSSELHVIDSTTFLILPRDGNGFGDTSSDSSFKDLDLISIKNATNIVNSTYTTSTTPVAPGGNLVSGVTPASLASFISLIEKSQISKFGLQVGGNIDRTLVASKLESIAIAPALDSSNPNDYFLFVVSDNDFIVLNGTQRGQVNGTGPYVLQNYSDPYAQQYGSADTQVFVWRATLPGYNQTPLPN